MKTLYVTGEQIDFIIQECMTSLEFGDYFDPYSCSESTTTDTTKHLVALTTLLHECVILKEEG